MADSKTINKRRNQIIEILKFNQEATMEELMKLCNIKQRTLLTEIKELRNFGFDIQRKNNVFKLENNTTSIVYEEADKRIMRQLVILSIFENKSKLSKKDIINSYKTQLLAYRDDKIIFDDSIRRLLDDDLKDLVKRNILKIKDSMLYTTLNTPVWSRIKLEKMEELRDRVSLIKKGHDAFGIWNSIEEKITNEIVQKLYGEENTITDEIITYETKQTVQVEKELQILTEISYSTKELIITYKTNKGYIYEKNIQIGAVIYSCEREKIYLLAKEMDNEKLSLFNLSGVISLTETEKNNQIFMNNDIKKIINEMFIVSVEDPFYVELEFDNVYNIHEKITRLAKDRKNAKYEIKDDKIVYYDCIRGLNDFARYIRGFGRSCKVIKPKELKDMIYESNEAVIKMYDDYFAFSKEE